MKEKLLRGRHALGLAARIIVSVIIIAVIIWKYDDLKHIDVRALIDGTSSMLAAAAGVVRLYGGYICSNPSSLSCPPR